ncbi:MAG TPA: hypothetical protein PKY81_09595 [bacterium]|nr:hypothetical protein [bacterium]HPN31199.1 hypothetical protein [bacterium]
MNNKNCSYYQEQIMLKFYNENFDATVSSHLENCLECRQFEKDLNEKLQFNFKDSDFVAVKNKIQGNSSLNYYNFKYFKYAAAVFLLLLIPVMFFQDKNERTLKKSILKGTQLDLTAKKNKGGEKTNISYTAFSDMESAITDLKSDMDNFITNIFTEVNYNEEI